MLRIRSALSCTLFLSAALLGCSDNGGAPLLSQVEPVVIPTADTGTQTNVNISNPTLAVPTTFPVSDGDDLTLVWSDEFDDAQLDPADWFFESGDGSQYGIPGWGNNEQQWYLPDNARLENGKLIITAKRETVGSFGYTSARITTQDRVAVKYGRIEASIKLPAGQGFWPAFWMLPQDNEQGSAPADGVYGSYSASGEIDIMEAVNLGGSPGPGGLGGGNEIFGTIHFGGEFPFNESTTVQYTPSESLTDRFNTFAVEWDEFEIRWFVNGTLYAVQNSWSSSAAPYPAPFDQPFNVLLNLAVGGDLPGAANTVTPFPATMEVDWVRIYSGEAPGGGMPTEPLVVAPIPDDDPADVISLFSDSFTDIGATFDTDFGQTTVFSEAQIAGNQLLKFANLDFQIIDFSANPQDVSDKDFLTIDVWTADSTELNVFLVSPGPVEASSPIPVTANSWVSVQIPLDEFAGVDLSNVIQIKLEGNGTVFVDNLYFGGEAPVTTPPNTELLTNGDLEAGQSPWIGQATVVDIGGNAVLQGVVTAPDPSQPFLVNASQVVPLTQGETYTLTFRARSTVEREMLAGIGLNVAPFTNVAEAVPLTTEWQAFTYTFTASDFGGADSRVLFDMNGEAGDVFIDDVSLKVGTLLTNGDFEAGQAPWIGQAIVVDDGGNAVLQGVVTAPDPGQPFLVNASQVLDITQGETYVLTFKARATVDRSMIAGIGLNVAPFTSQTESVPLTTSWQTFSYTLTASDFGGADSRVLFDMNAEAGDVFIDDVTLSTIPPINTGSGGGGGSGSGTELAVNGGFESGDFANWQQSVNSGVQTISTDTPADGGSFSAALSANTAPGQGGTTEIKQANLGAGTLALGDVLTISFDVKGSFGPAGQLNVLSFTEFSGGGGDLSDQQIITGGVDDWTTRTYNVTLSGSDAGGGFSLAFNPVCGAVEGCTADVLIDNVSIVLN